MYLKREKQVELFQKYSSNKLKEIATTTAASKLQKLRFFSVLSNYVGIPVAASVLHGLAKKGLGLD